MGWDQVECQLTIGIPKVGIVPKYHWQSLKARSLVDLEQNGILPVTRIVAHEAGYEEILFGETYIGVIKPMIVTQWISVHVVIIPTCSRIFFLENAITILVVCGYSREGQWL